MKLRGIGMVKVNKTTNLKNKSYEWLLTEKMKLEYGMKSVKENKRTRINDIKAMEAISSINQELASRR